MTRGRNGMSVFRGGAPPVHVPAHGSQDAVDVTGAGDTVAATFCAGLAAGGDPVAAARLANVAGALVVQKPGDGHGDPGGARGGAAPAVKRRSASAPLADLPRAPRGRHRRAGRTIALANGVFDLFHVGHLRYLAGAKAHPTCSWSR